MNRDDRTPSSEELMAMRLHQVTAQLEDAAEALRVLLDQIRDATEQGRST